LYRFQHVSRCRELRNSQRWRGILRFRLDLLAYTTLPLHRVWHRSFDRNFLLFQQYIIYVSWRRERGETCTHVHCTVDNDDDDGWNYFGGKTAAAAAAAAVAVSVYPLWSSLLLRLLLLPLPLHGRVLFSITS